MTETLSSAAARLRRGARQLDAARADLTALDADHTAFGADGPGRLGQLGRDLAGQYARAIDARADELSAHCARLIETAAAVERAGHGYAEIDAQRRRPEVP